MGLRERRHKPKEPGECLRLLWKCLPREAGSWLPGRSGCLVTLPSESRAQVEEAAGCSLVGLVPWTFGVGWDRKWDLKKQCDHAQLAREGNTKPFTKFFLGEQNGHSSVLLSH